MLRVVVFAVMLVVSGCAQLIDKMASGGSSAPQDPEAHWVYQGKECPEDRRLILSRGESDDDRAFDLLCTEWPGYSQGVDLTMDMQVRHAKLDDRRFDPMAVGLMVLTCARFCSEADRIDLGMIAGLAASVDPGAFRRSIDHLAWSPEAKQFLTDRVAEAGPLLVAAANRLDARRQALYIELPGAIRADRAAYYQKHGREYAALDALAPAQHRGDRAMIDQLVELRAAYFSACGAPDCRFDPFVTEITREIVLGALAAGDELTATLDGTLFAEQSALRNSYPPMIHRAQYLAMKQEEERWEDYDHARNDGNDDAALAARFGATPPIHITADSAYEGSDGAPSLLVGSPEKFHSVTGTVSGVHAKGGFATITFEDVVSKYELTDCVETNRLDGIGSDGRLIYRQRCRSVGTRTERHVTAPIRVPKRDAAGVHPREELTAFVDGDRVGGVVAVRNAKAQLVQFRMHRLRPDAKYAVISPTADVDPGKK